MREICCARGCAGSRAIVVDSYTGTPGRAHLEAARQAPADRARVESPISEAMPEVGIRLSTGRDHDIDCLNEGIDSMAMKPGFVRKARATR
jgi:hypothetical protein